MSELPAVVEKYLARHNMVAVSKQELIDLRGLKLNREERHDDLCRDPLFPRWGVTGQYMQHGEYLGSILQKDGDPMSGLSVVRCAACGNVTFELPVAIA